MRIEFLEQNHSRPRRAAYRLGPSPDLPIDPQGPVLFPDAQIEYIDADETTGRVNIEVARGTFASKK